MKHYFIAFIFSFSVAAQASGSSSQVQVFSNGPVSYCQPEQPEKAFLRSSDFVWNYSLELMKETFQTIYSNTDKRLPKRLYWDEKQKSFYLPYMTERGGSVKVTSSFLDQISKHIQTAFEKDYIDHVFFPDMGHSHLLVPEKKWQKVYDPIPVDQFSKLYEKVFQDKDLKILYHTAEQLQTLDENDQLLPDPRLQHRFKTRNIVGPNNGKSELEVFQNPSSKANTVSEVPGYFWFSSGFNLSSNQEGCLVYKKDQKEYRFDLSLYDLE